MDIKDKIRQRRADRLRELHETSHHTVFPSVYSFGNQDRNAYPPVYSDNRYEDSWNEDPEYAWKKKWEREMAAADRRGVQDGINLRFPSKNHIRIKVVTAVLVFGLVWGMFKIDHPLAVKGREYVKAALTQSYDFNRLAVWYEQTFNGSPSLLPALRSLRNPEAQKVAADVTRHYFAPVQGKIISPFEPQRLGITVQTKANSPVFALDTGRVVFSGKKESTGYTVIIQHANGMQSIYGLLGKPMVEVNAWVKGGETIGTAGDQTKQNGSADGLAALYFAVTKDNTFINPTEVVSFD
jgi:stage IV sporulation protein FA